MLIAPLDWGLGHATRCIPIVKKMLSAGFKVIMAAEGDQKILLQKEFPHLEILHLKGYRLQYAKTRLGTLAKIIFQIPKILMAINTEKRWLENVITIKHLDAVISDNRFGLYNHQITSIFITHQLHIKTLLGKFIDTRVQTMNYRFINRFTQCWVPDLAGTCSLAGDLSHPTRLPNTPVRYIGFLSRIKKQPEPVSGQLLVLLSGPEPQRTIVETMLLHQLNHYAGKVVLVRGLPTAAADSIADTPSLTVFNYLSGIELQQVINEAGVVISRPGYSTVMDLLPLGKKCIFIPTPGQAEQEYLAAYLSARGFAIAGHQHNFSLAKLLEQAQQLALANLTGLTATDNVSPAIDELLAVIASKQQTSQ